MNLRDLLDIERVGVAPDAICLMRHTNRELGDYLLDPCVFRFYTSVQKTGRLDRYGYVMAFIVNSSGKTVFQSMYRVAGKSTLRSDDLEALFLPGHIIDYYSELARSGDYSFYSLEPTIYLSAYSGRLVVNWGKAALAWFQSFSTDRPKDILEILPSGFFRAFDGYASISLTRSELEFLYENCAANPEWISHLSRVAGVYLILDEGTGSQYIGSASGRRGVWGRWSNYCVDPTGGNVMLESLLKSDAKAYRRFRYSLLEAVPGNALSHEVVAKEAVYKKMLGTRVYGLNLN